MSHKTEGNCTAAKAAGQYRNGACFPAWPVGEDGGDWLSVRANMSSRQVRVYVSAFRSRKDELCRAGMVKHAGEAVM